MKIIMGGGVPVRVPHHLSPHTYASVATFYSHDQTPPFFVFLFFSSFPSPMVVRWVRKNIILLLSCSALYALSMTVLPFNMDQHLYTRSPFILLIQSNSHLAFIDSVCTAAIIGDSRLSWHGQEVPVFIKVRPIPSLLAALPHYLSIFCPQSPHKVC